MEDNHNQKINDHFIFIGFLILIAWVPLPLGSNRAWAWSLMEMGTYILSIFWVMLWLRQRVTITAAFIKAKPVIYLFIAWLSWIFIQTVPLPLSILELVSSKSAFHYSQVADDPSGWFPISLEINATQEGWLKSFAYVQIFCLTLLLVNSRRRVRALVTVIIFSGLFQAAYGSLMTLSGLEYGFFIKKSYGLDTATGTFTNRNHLAGYLEMCLAIGIGTMIGKLDTSGSNSWRERLKKFIELILGPKMRLRLYLIIMVIALVLTRSRMGNSAFFASLLIAGSIALILSRHATRQTIIFIASLVIIDIFIVGTWYGLERVVERIEQTSLETEHRDETYRNVWEQWHDYKLTGSGLGSFYAVFPAYKSRTESGGFYRHAHNDYLQFASETGIIGISLLGIIVITSLAMALWAHYKRKNPRMRGLSFAVIMGIISLLIHSSVDFNLQIPANAIMFTLLLALAWITVTLKYYKAPTFHE